MVCISAECVGSTIGTAWAHFIAVDLQARILCRLEHIRALGGLIQPL